MFFLSEKKCFLNIKIKVFELCKTYYLDVKSLAHYLMDKMINSMKTFIQYLLILILNKINIHIT